MNILFILKVKIFVLIKWSCRVEAAITDHLRDFVSNMEKYKVVQVFPM